MIKITFVCTGNTCRSAMAEIIFKQLVKNSQIKGIRVSSRGLKVEQTSINEKAKIALKKLGYRLVKVVPTQADFDFLSKQNFVVCATDKHKQALEGLNNVYSISELSGVGEISDPYGLEQANYDSTARILEYACDKILKKIVEGKL